MDKKMKLNGIGSVLVLGMCYSSIASSGIRVGWSMDAMGCVPTEETARKNILIQVAGKVKFRKGKTGSITLICPISSAPLTPETISGSASTIKQLLLTYKDGDAQAPGGLVSASLRFVDRKTGHIANLESISSNTPAAPNSGPGGFATYGKPKLKTNTPVPGINHSFRFSKYFYFIQITLKRSSPRIPVSVMGVALRLG
ncbi:hypothetical protein [Thiolapillus sp.]